MSTSTMGRMFAFLPLGIFFVALVTILSAYFAAFENEDLQFLGGRVKTPPISMLMFAGPGKRIGQVGFPLVSLLGCTCLPPFFRGIEEAVGQGAHKRTLSFLRLSILIAFSSLAIVGLLPLQPDLALAMKKEVAVSKQSIIHQGAASIFFLFAILHMGTWLYFATKKCSHTLPYYYKNSKKSFYFKLLCFLLCFFPLPVAVLLHPVSPVNKRLSLTRADAGGIMQYALVACVSCFFASYSCEMWQMEKERMKKKAKD
eukprot:scaffold7641_cov115-Cylindrotheca_fusiformis.AAC.14